MGVDTAWEQPYTWPGMIVCIPFLPNRRARSNRQPRLPSARPIIRFLREMALAIQQTYTQVEVHDRRKHILYTKASETIRHPALELTANHLEWIFSKRWLVTQHNPFTFTIAAIRWQARIITGKAHDKELIDLIDAAFRATGRAGFPMELEAFKKSRHMTDHAPGRQEKTFGTTTRSLGDQSPANIFFSVTLNMHSHL